MLHRVHREDTELRRANFYLCGPLCCSVILFVTILRLCQFFPRENCPVVRFKTAFADCRELTFQESLL